jgi:hypothetical protein
MVFKFHNMFRSHDYRQGRGGGKLHITLYKKKFWEELIVYFPSIRHGPHRKRRVKQFFYCCMCICCRGNIFTEPLPSNERGLHIQTHRLMGGIYEVRR